MKGLILIMDGMGDRPIKELGNKTPLEAANTPNMDKMAAEGITGIMDSIAPGIIPGSDTAHLSILGYNPYEMRSDGALLLVTNEGHTLVEALAQEGIAAEVIGMITDGNDKVILNDEEKRYLEPPRK